MLWRLILCFLFLASVSLNSFSQAIYRGGNGDGFKTAGYTQASNSFLNIYGGGNADGFTTAGVTQADNVAYNIYHGGNADGFVSASVIQADNVAYNIYNGGIADGFVTASIIQADNIAYNIYNGGIADGFVTASIIQSDNVAYNIYNGGIADGFVTLSIIQADNVSYNIYNGGIADGFSVSTVGSVGNEVPLPIELLSFVGNCSNKNVQLTWSTASEINNDYFTLESSSDGENWIIIGIVHGAGNSSRIHNYSFTDTELYNHVSYWRLKQTDFNGQFKYSQTIAVELCGEDLTDNLTIYPNPSKGTFNLLFNGDKVLVNSIEIYNAYGERVYYSGSYQSLIDLSNKQSGMYMVYYLLDNKINVEKIVIER